MRETKKKEKREKKERETPAPSTTGPKQVYRPKVKAANEGEVQHHEESKVEEVPKVTVTDT